MRKKNRQHEIEKLENPKKYSQEEICQMARDFIKQNVSNGLINCPVCGSLNCMYNDTCIVCNCQL